MAVDNIEVVDFIGTEIATQHIILTICDHLDWLNELDHLLILQDKINMYIAFVESGQIYEAYPDAIDRHLVIEIVGKYELSGLAKEFFIRASEIVASAGLEMRFRHLK